MGRRVDSRINKLQMSESHYFGLNLKLGQLNTTHQLRNVKSLSHSLSLIGNNASWLQLYSKMHKVKDVSISA